MRPMSAIVRTAHVLALCAMALLSYATVRSTLMQASMTQVAETCGEVMPGMAGMTSKAVHPGKGKAAQSCEFCAAAAHAPLHTVAPTLATPAAVAWSPHLAWRTSGPRGPPTRPAHARGPPSTLLI